MNILFIKYFCVGFMVSEIPRVSIFGYFSLHIYSYIYIYIYTTNTRIYIIIIMNRISINY